MKSTSENEICRVCCLSEHIIQCQRLMITNVRAIIVNTCQARSHNVIYMYTSHVISISTQADKKCIQSFGIIISSRVRVARRTSQNIIDEREREHMRVICQRDFHVAHSTHSLLRMYIQSERDKLNVQVKCQIPQARLQKYKVSVSMCMQNKKLSSLSQPCFYLHNRTRSLVLLRFVLFV